MPDLGDALRGEWAVSEFSKVTSKADLNSLDEDEMVAGYLAGKDGVAEPGSAFSRSYWHGWRNGASDFKHREIDDEQLQLAREIVGRNMRMH